MNEKKNNSDRKSKEIFSEIELLFDIAKRAGWIKRGKILYSPTPKPLSSRQKTSQQDTVPITTPWGSDAVSILTETKRHIVMSSDQHIEGTHFDTSFMTYDEVGERALRCASSDIFATGIKPSFALTNISSPSRKIIREIEEGILRCAKKLDIKILGGDIAKSDRVQLSVFVFGVSEGGGGGKGAEKAPLSRFGAEEGDHIFITGNVGDAALALAVLKKKGRKFAEKYIPGALKKFLFPPVEKAFKKLKIVMEKFDVKFSADLSDGPLAALQWISILNKKHIEFFPERLPISDEFIRFAHEYFDDPSSIPATWGDDYEIIFGISEKDAQKHMNEIRKEKNEVIGIVLSDDDKKRAIKKKYPYIKLKVLGGKNIFIFMTHRIKAKTFSHF